MNGVTGEINQHAQNRVVMDRKLVLRRKKERKKGLNDMVVHVTMSLFKQFLVRLIHIAHVSINIPFKYLHTILLAYINGKYKLARFMFLNSRLRLVCLEHRRGQWLLESMSTIRL